MTNEETLELLKPIMLDGSEKVGDKVYCLPFGEVEITDIKEDDEYPIFINVFETLNFVSNLFPLDKNLDC